MGLTSYKIRVFQGANVVIDQAGITTLKWRGLFNSIRISPDGVFYFIEELIYIILNNFTIIIRWI
jgi:hypothetical protein